MNLARLLLTATAVIVVASTAQSEPVVNIHPSVYATFRSADPSQPLELGFHLDLIGKTFAHDHATGDGLASAGVEQAGESGDVDFFTFSAGGSLSNDVPGKGSAFAHTATAADVVLFNPTDHDLAMTVELGWGMHGGVFVDPSAGERARGIWENFELLTINNTELLADFTKDFSCGFGDPLADQICMADWNSNYNVYDITLEAGGVAHLSLISNNQAYVSRGVPEPVTVSMFGVAFLGAVWLRRRDRRPASS